MTDKPLRILANAYACGPNWGSEIGMGWNWVINLSNYCELTVVTEKGFKNDIEEALPLLQLKYRPKFHYIDIGEKGRSLFWQQGSYAFYEHYKSWQKQVYDYVKELMIEENFDIVHQLNMIGYREPGYLWKIEGTPFVIGPVGGYEQFPFAFLPMLNVKDMLFALARNAINFIQKILLTRPKKAYRNANYVIAATPIALRPIRKYAKGKVVIIPETGAYKLVEGQTSNKKSVTRPFTITWVGNLHGRKALPLALKAIAKSKYNGEIVFNVIGYGPNLRNFKNMASGLKLDNLIWHGKIPNVEVKNIISNSDLFFFTSLLDATSTVIFEALERNVPVLCHDTCGFGHVIDSTCGIKIPLENPKNSIRRFSFEIDRIIEDPERLIRLKKGCSLKIKDYYWEQKAMKMEEIYRKCLH